jgi:hypothetical protein
MTPPANMANPCSGSDVAARPSLATLSAAVVQRPLVASKMSTMITPPAQRISAHPQRLKKRLPPPNTRPLTPTPHNLPISTTHTKYDQSLLRQGHGCKNNSCHAERSSRPTSTRRIENVNSIAETTSCATHQRSSPAPQTAPPSTQHTPPDSHITHNLPISTIQYKNHIRTILTACEYGQSLLRQ